METGEFRTLLRTRSKGIYLIPGLGGPYHALLERKGADGRSQAIQGVQGLSTFPDNTRPDRHDWVSQAYNRVAGCSFGGWDVGQKERRFCRQRKRSADPGQTGSHNYRWLLHFEIYPAPSRERPRKPVIAVPNRRRPHKSHPPMRTAVIAMATLLPMPASVSAQTAPVAVSDAINVAAGRMATPIGGLLANDLLVDGDSIIVEVVSGPLHGTAVVGVAGAITYDPDPGFVGPDSLVYRIRRLPTARLAVDAAASELSLRASLAIPNFGSDTDEIQLSVAGHLDVIAWPDEAPYDSISVFGLALANTEASGLSFDYGSLGIVVLTVELEAAAGAIQLSMLQPGAAAETGFAGLFAQTGNELGVIGAVGVRGSGTLGGLVPSGDQVFDTSTTTDLSGLASRTGSTTQVILTIDLNQQVDIGGNAAEIWIAGEVVSEGPSVETLFSNEAVVRFNVVSGVAIETPAALSLAIFPNPSVGAVAVTMAPGAFQSLDVVDVLGRVQASQVLGHLARADLDLRDLAPGLYFVRLRGTRGVQVTRPLILSR
jgi:Bacterial Ig domain/Secretion system C-terminal sorting domain